MYKLIFLLLKQRLNSKIPSIKEVTRRAEDAGKFKVSPSLYFTFQPTEMRSLGLGIQEGEVFFTVVLKSDCLADDDKIYDQPYPDHDDFANLIHQHLSDYSGWLSDLPAFAALKDTPDDRKVFNTIDRTHIDQSAEQKAIMRTVQTFKCYAKDYTGNKTYQKIIKGLEIHFPVLTNLNFPYKLPFKLK